jgi:hypothetical protein
VSLTCACIQRVLAVPPIPPRAHPSGNTLEMNCFNYENFIEKIEKCECIYCHLVNTPDFL